MEIIFAWNFCMQLFLFGNCFCLYFLSWLQPLNRASGNYSNISLQLFCLHFRLGQISTPTFYPRETRHVWSNLLLSAGILAQYKTFHGEIYTISIFFIGFFLVIFYHLTKRNLKKQKKIDGQFLILTDSTIFALFFNF